MMQPWWGEFTDDVESNISFSLGCDVPLARFDGGAQCHPIQALQAFQLSQVTGGSQQGLTLTCGTREQQER